MRLIGIDCQVPSNKICNEEIVELIKFYSDGVFNNDIASLEAMVKKILNKTGIKSRFWRKNKERPIDLILLATNNALKMSGLKRDDIDLVIYSSIDRGFIEPANASIMCRELGFKNTRCFDIVDACMGWCSAVQVTQSLLNSDPKINSILIINAEFPMDRTGTILPQNFSIKNFHELKWKSPSFTLGEGASATIFQKETSSFSRFEFIECPEYADLCKISLLNNEKYIFEQNIENNSRDLQFYAAGGDLAKKGVDLSVQVLLSLLCKIDYIPEMIFPHSVSDIVIKEAASKICIKSPIYSTVSELGNIATVSIPSAIKKAMLNNIIKGGEKTIGWIASAGMKFSAFEIQL